MPDDQLTADVLAFMRQLWELDHALQRMSKRMHGTLGVTGPQRLAVRMVGRLPGLSATELATLMHVDPGTLTGILRRMEQQGLVHRRRDPRDRRRWQLGLTARGRAVDARRHGTVEEAVRDMMHEARARDVEAAKRVLQMLVKHLQASGEVREYE